MLSGLMLTKDPKSGNIAINAHPFAHPTVLLMVFAVPRDHCACAIHSASSITSIPIIHSHTMIGTELNTFLPSTKDLNKMMPRTTHPSAEPVIYNPPIA
jgi:hypothetical protein